jgi:hypothetical protein
MHRLVMAFLSIAAVAGVLHPQMASADKIGVASAVKNEVQGIMGASPRALAAGSDVFSSERIRTGQESTAQLLFLDETSLNVGPQSEITLDRFVYNPSRNTGNVVLSASRGAFRFVTGSQNPTNYTLRTPVATIGVRGSIYDLFLRSVPAGVHEIAGLLILVEGSLKITLRNGKVLLLNELGKAVVFYGDGTYEVVTWDGSINSVVGNISFPLFGTTFGADPRRFEIPDDQGNLNDILKTGPFNNQTGG